MPVEFSIFIAAWFWTHFDPIQDRLHAWAAYWFEQGFLTRSLEAVYEVTTCFYCFAFWLALVLTMEPLTAMAIGFFAYTYKKIVEKC